MSSVYTVLKGVFTVYLDQQASSYHVFEDGSFYLDLDR